MGQGQAPWNRPGGQVLSVLDSMGFMEHQESLDSWIPSSNNNRDTHTTNNTNHNQFVANQQSNKRRNQKRALTTDIDVNLGLPQQYMKKQPSDIDITGTKQSFIKNSVGKNSMRYAQISDNKFSKNFKLQSKLHSPMQKRAHSSRYMIDLIHNDINHRQTFEAIASDTDKKTEQKKKVKKK